MAGPSSPTREGTLLGGRYRLQYALFNLGQALRQAGRPEQAVPVLRRRLEIPNQTDTVRAELGAAVAEAD